MKAFAVAVLVSIANIYAQKTDLPSSCDVSARTESGVVCGRIRNATDGTKYASFRGIPYIKPPLGELRFAPPQKPDSWDSVYDASEVGPCCHQFDPVYGPILQPVGMDEDCLFINVHTPELNLPDPPRRSSRKLPVLVWVHGGSFSFGSGDADLHGPEYLMANQDIIVVTFNYRINVFGYLSLETEKVPGNNGLRDTIFALEWIQNNIENFGGDPADVTLGGHSAGAATAHLIAISPVTKGRNLFKKVMCISGTAIANFYSYSPSYSQLLRRLFLIAARINPLQSPDEIYKDLIEAPITTLMRANKFLLDLFGLAGFGPVIENSDLNITAIIPKDPEVLLNEGFGKEYPTLLSFTDNECESFKNRLREASMATKYRLVPALTVPLNLLFNAKLLTIPVLTGKMRIEYFNLTFITLEKFLPACTDGFFKYPAMRVARQRLATRAEDTFVYEFGYPGENSVLKMVQNRNWTGAAHLEDHLYFFRANSVMERNVVNELKQGDPDSKMKLFMTESIARFVRTGRPAPARLLGRNRWPATDEQLQFLNIENPDAYNFTEPTPYMVDKMEFFDRMYRIGRDGNFSREASVK